MPVYADPLIQQIKTALEASGKIPPDAIEMYEIMAKFEHSISTTPSPHFFTPLPLKDAFQRMDAKYKISKRRHIPPSHQEIRQTLNLAQVLASAPHVKLVTFDGDETLYSNGGNFECPEMGKLIVSLLACDMDVAVVTAAGYGEKPEGYEGRLRLLLWSLANSKLTSIQRQRFWVFGGEANYLFRATEEGRLSFIPYSHWQELCPLVLTPERDLPAATALLDVAENALKEMAAELSLRVTITRKERATGMTPGGPEGLRRAPLGSGAKSIREEILEEAVARVKEAITASGSTVPYCAFNGGSDVWVDVGNKALALGVLQAMLNLKPSQCLHLGDQFAASGNDLTVRQRSPCIWVVNPSETRAVLRRLLREIHPQDEIGSDQT